MAFRFLDKLGFRREEWRAMTVYGRFEQFVSWVLTFSVSAVVLVATYRLLVDVFSRLVLGALDPLDHEAFQAIFGGIMTLLIALEFGHSILHAAARSQSIVQVKTVLLIALLALSRKIIILDLKVVSPSTIVALGVALLALGTVYWLLRERDDRRKKRAEGTG